MAKPDYGALVISLDFELHWGVRDTRPPDGDYRGNLLGVRYAIPRMLDLFEKYKIAATWATVGFLFARSRAEFREFMPTVRPKYEDTALYPYSEPLGQGESDDPLHFAPSLIETIRSRPGQEIGSHTYSHYYCLAPGQEVAHFEADMRSAVRIARRRRMVLRSIAFPRNQFNANYLAVIRNAGIRAYRGNEESWIYQPRARQSFPVRGARLLDQYVSLSGVHLSRWEDIEQPDGLANIPASRFLRPYSHRLRHLDGLRMHRIDSEMLEAARSQQVYHLWWHPHNFGANTEENLAFLDTILFRYSRLRTRYGMQSMNMAAAADAVLPAMPKEALIS